ncbi:hypothetical protein J6590_010926 [Homalodisca vitripennis]|nr:hypothetical protein J6590_010926 [Homalodisca vitripennis]
MKASRLKQQQARQAPEAMTSKAGGLDQCQVRQAGGLINYNQSRWSEVITSKAGGMIAIHFVVAFQPHTLAGPSLTHSGVQENNTEAGQSEAEQKPRLRAVTEYIILYCGSQRGTLDQVSLALFPLSFLVFTVVYWVTYLNEAKRRDAV